MACTCVREVEQKILSGLAERYPERTYEEINHFEDGGFENVSLSLGKNGGTMVYFPFKSRYTFTKVNGSTSAPKTEKVSIYPTYCPFCGVKVQSTVEDEGKEVQNG